MNRLKTKEIAAYRQKTAEAQELSCAICGYSLAGRIAHLDHDHKTGMVRGVLHRECNTLLGKIENFINSYGHPNINEFLREVGYYMMIHKHKPSNVYHPSYKTDEEKRLRKNSKARKMRVTKRKGVKK